MQCGLGHNGITLAWSKLKEFIPMRKALSICTAICFLFLIIGVTWADDMAKESTVKGWISDSRCGAQGANPGAAACTKKCLGSGASMVVVTDEDQKVLTVSNPESLKGHEGHHVAVTGQVSGDSIHVESAKLL
jgi:hypothetical protein